MFNPTLTENAAPAGISVLELTATPDVPDASAGSEVVERPPRDAWRAPRPAHAALERTELLGTITGPLAALRLVQRFRVPPALATRTLEARYRFPLPGDAAVTGVVVRFGDTEVATTLKPRPEAQADYAAARAAGHQAALLEREAPDVYTLTIAGLQGTEAVEVETRFVLRARLAGGRWSARVPLTTVPRFVRADEAGLPQADAQPLAVLRDPGHRFALDVTVAGEAVTPLAVTSPTHALRTDALADGRVRVRLDAGEVVPDRDCVLEWRAAAGERPALELVAEDAPDGAHRYVMVLVRPAADEGPYRGLPRDLTLLVDRSGSMSGAKWDATRWAIRRLVAGLAPHDRLRLAVFDDHTIWFDGPSAPTADLRPALERFLDAHGPHGGTELGTALEAALARRPELAAPAGRHCVVLTDGQVSDAGRIVEVVRRERARRDARRVSVLCIDSAPNASLAADVAEAGGGGAHFLSSAPTDGDVATALEHVLEGFGAPAAVDLTVTVDRAAVESAAGGVTRADGRATLALGDLVAGRPAWAVLRLGADAARGATLRVAGTGLSDLTLPLPAPSPGPDGAVRAAFGVRRLHALERIATAGLTQPALAERLGALGYDAAAELAGDAVPTAVYAPNALPAAATALRALLVRESLATGVPSTATAFVAVRAVAGQVVDESVAVPSALAAGWSENFITPIVMPSRTSAADMSMGYFASPCAAPSPARSAARSFRAKFTRLRQDELDAPREDEALDMPMEAHGMSARYAPAPDADDTRRALLFRGRPDTPTAHGGEIVLFDGDTPIRGGTFPARLARLRAVLTGAEGAVPARARLDLYVGDLTVPAVSVDLATLLAAGGERPLHLACAAGTRVRLVLVLPQGTGWPDAAGEFAVALEG